MRRLSEPTTLRPDPPSPSPALVIERWNSWARVAFPDTGETMWVDLDEVPFQQVTGSGARPADE